MLWLLLLTQPEPLIAEVLPQTLEQYRWFHQHPELSEQEAQTAARLADALASLGLTVVRNVGGHGVVATLRNGAGPTVLFRADLDALPIQEKTGLPYASQNSGVMHACGHDIHMANALGTIAVMAKTKAQWKGTLLFVGQPAEEKGAGALAVIKDKKFKRVLAKVGKPKVALAIHDTADYPAGVVGAASGWFSANVDSVDVTIHGKGGHGAKPHEAVDPILIGAEIVVALQSIVSRRIAPGTRAVITVGKFAGGTKHNIIPPSATLLLTVRSYGDDTRKLLLEEIRRVVLEVAKAHRAPKPPTITFQDDFTPAGYNDPAWTKRLTELFATKLGKKNVRVREPSTGGEDFSEYARQLKIPAVMWAVGAYNRKRFARAKPNGLFKLHSDRFAPEPKPTLETSILTSVLALQAAFSDSR